MKEIIFRGKRMDNREWYYGSYLFLHISSVDWTGAKRGKPEDVHYIVNDQDINYAVYPSTIGQYTGLKDKNGKRIFEGDVAKVLQGKDKGIAYVGFENGAFMLYPKTGNIYERTLWEYWYNDWDVEVIGNITDNHELLEK